jgi:hypothetical protein
MAIRTYLSRVMGERRVKIQDVAGRSGLAYTTVFALYHDQARWIDLSTLGGVPRASTRWLAICSSTCPTSQRAKHCSVYVRVIELRVSNSIERRESVVVNRAANSNRLH